MFLAGACGEAGTSVDAGLSPDNLPGEPPTAFALGESSILSSDDYGNANMVLAQQASLTQPGTILGLSFYVTTASGKLRLGVYDASGPGGGPGVRAAATAEFTPVAGWNTAPVTTPVVLPSGTYWLAFAPSSNSLHFRVTHSGSARWYSRTYTTLPTTFSTSPTSGAYHWSLYAAILPIGLTNQAPIVATAAAATPGPVTGTTAALTVQGDDDAGEPNLTYTWATTGTPPAAVTFSANGTNTAKSTTATFTKAGAYTLQATITDGPGLTVTSTVTVTVVQTATTITVSPASATVAPGGTQAFSAGSVDQFGNPMVPAPALTWTVSAGGTISAAGLFTAGASMGGPYVVRASAGAASGTAGVTVAGNLAPAVTTAAAAAPNPVSGTTTGLSVLGTDDGGEPNLTYTWATTGAPPAAVTFSANGTNAAKATTATFTRAGSYTLQATIKDGPGLTITSNVTVIVTQTLTTVTVSPAAATVVSGGTWGFSASTLDQFGQAMAPAPTLTWTVSGGGIISTAGLFTSGAASGGPYVVTATSGAKNGTASVTVVAGSSTTIGETSILPTPDAGNANLMMAQQAVLAQTGTLQSLSFYVATAAGKLRLGIYDATGSGGGPGAKKAETAEITPVAGWNTAPVITPVLLPAGTYWLTYLTNSSSLAFRVTTSGAARWYSFTYSTMPATYATSASSGTYHWSLYGSIATTPVNQAPTVATAASATPSPVTGTTAALSVLGADDGGESGLNYAWATTGSPPAAVTFSDNGTNAAKNTTATFSKAGTYSLRATITDGPGSTVTSTVTVTVTQTVTEIAVSPATATVAPGATQAFTASSQDQFGNTMTPTLTWTVSAGGIISAAGLFTAGAGSGGPYVITAHAGAASGTASVTVAGNLAPTVASAAAATPAPVTGTTAALSVLGADDAGEAGLTYTWATTGSPPAAVTFSENGTNAAKTTTATFSKAGAYTLRATITDGSGLTVTSTVSVTVSQTVTTITVSPAAATVAPGATQAFSAASLDQFGNAMAPAPTFTWTVSAGGTISAAGLFTAGAGTGGPYVVTAGAGTASGTADVTVAGNPAPTVATAAAATPNPVTGTTTALSVLGADNGGEAGLTYTWATTGTPPAAVTFSANGTNAAKATTATFTRAGSYTLQATIKDGPGLTVTSSVTVTVAQTLTTVTVAPSTATVTIGGTWAFGATTLDQFGQAMAPAPTLSWTVSGGGTISAAGLFTAGAVSGGPYVVTASSGAKSGTASVTVAAAPTTTIGETSVLSTPDAGNANLLLAQQATLAQTGTVQSLSFYVTTATGKLRLGVYDATGSGGGPGAKKAETAEITPVAGWNTAPVITPVSLPAGTYWLTYLTNSSSLAFRVTTSGAARWYSYTYATMPTSYASSATSGTYHWSLYGSLSTAPANQAPTVASAAAASPSPVTGTTTTLSALGADDSGEPGLSYTWATTGTPPAAVSFSPNGSNTAKSTTATFAKAGSYSLRVTIADAQGLTVTSTVAVTVAQALSSILVTPASASVTTLAQQTFAAAARDQFTQPMSPTPAFSWSVTGGGSMSTGGVFTAGIVAGGPHTVTASSGGVSGTAAVTVAPLSLTQLTMLPGTVSLAFGQTQAFSVAGLLSNGLPTIPLVSYSATGGTITANGVFTAGSTPGTFRVIATALDWPMADTATVTIAATLVQHGLDFPGSNGVVHTMRFNFTSPISYPATFIMRVYPRAQSGYYTAFFYGNEGAFQPNNDFYGFHPYPNWNSSDPTAHVWEIAAPPGVDIGTTPVVFNQWYQQAAVVSKSGNTTTHTFYWDLSDPARSFSYVSTGSQGPPSSPVITVGDAPWNQGREVWNGILAGFQFYDVALTAEEIAQEIAAPGSSAQGSHLWYLNLNPTPTDISDKSGRGHNPVWVGTERPGLW